MSLADDYVDRLNPGMFLRPDAPATKPLDFDELRIANLKRLPHFPHMPNEGEDDWSLQDWAVAAAGEMGEMCNLVKKLRRGEPVDPADVGREIADTITYLDFVAWKLGLDMGQEVIRKWNEVSERIGSDIRL